MRTSVVPMSEDVAACVLTALRSGKTLNSVCGGRLNGKRVASERITYYENFRAYCAIHPEYARETNALLALNTKLANAQKGAYKRNMTQCKRGHSLADAYVHVSAQGWVMRNCRICHQMRRDEPRPLSPVKLEKVKSMLLAEKPIAEITGQWLRGTKREVTVNTTQFYNARKADPDFDLFVRAHIPAANARAQALRGSIYRARKVTTERREQANDYHVLRALIPSHIPDPDEIVSRIIEDILTGALVREPLRRQSYAAQSFLFPPASLSAPVFDLSSCEIKGQQATVSGAMAVEQDHRAYEGGKRCRCCCPGNCFSRRQRC